jgi:ribonuclease/clavin/mitogillin
VDSSLTPHPGIILLSPPVQTPPGWDRPNLYLIGARDLILIDAGFPAEPNLAMILEAIGDRSLKSILLTHGHRDHIGAAAEIREAKGAEILCHEADFPLIEGRFAGLMPDRAISERETFSADEFELEAIETPGHSPGHLCFWMKKERILISGDLVVGAGTTLVGPPDGNMKAYMDSLEKVRNLRPALILPGHGPVVQDPNSKINELIEHRQLREIQIAKVLETGPKNLADLLNAIYIGLIHPGLHGAAVCTILGHLEKLIEENKVASEPENAPPEKRTYRLTVPTLLPFG